MASTLPPFARYMTAAASSSHIALYSVTNGASKINMFDVAAPLYTSSVTLPFPTDDTSPTNGTSPDASSSGTPLGAIIGGVVGGVALVALVLFFVIRRLCGGYKKTDASETASQEIEFVDHHKMPKLATNYVVMQPEPRQHLQNQVAHTLPPPHHAYAISPPTACYNTPTDLNLIYAANNIQASMAKIPAYHQVQPVVGINQNSYIRPYTYATPVVSTHSSPTISQAQVVQEHHDQALGGSPLTVYEAAPKIRGSPQATTTSADIPTELLHPSPRNPQGE